MSSAKRKHVAHAARMTDAAGAMQASRTTDETYATDAVHTRDAAHTAHAKLLASNVNSNALTRRGFLRAAGLGALACAGVGASGLLSGCAVDEFLSGERTVTDSTGREVCVPTPERLSRIYFTSPLAQTFCFTMAPDLLAGTTIQFNKRQLDFLPYGTEDLSFMGSLASGGVIDAEALKVAGVQVVFSISGVGITDVNVADALELERQSGIPVFLIDGSLHCIGDTYRLLGEVLGRRERAEELAGFCERTLDEVTSAIDTLPERERVSYYFAEGPEGLQTEPNDSQHALAFLTAGGVNVAANVGSPATASGYADVSIEQVRAWNPDFIVAWDWESRGGAADYIRAAEDWKGISAVDQGHVYAMPCVPFPFCDRPPGVNRLLGIQWLANLFYPEVYNVDMVEVVRSFYHTCYWRDISHSQARKILGLEDW